MLLFFNRRKKTHPTEKSGCVKTVFILFIITEKAVFVKSERSRRSILFCVAINAAICLRFGVCQPKNMVEVALRRGYASRIFAKENIRQHFGSGNLLFLDDFAVFYDIDCHGRVNIADNIKVDFYIRIYFDYIFFSFFAARNISYHRNRTVKLVEMKKSVKLHAVAGANVVNDKACFHAVYIHTLTPKSFIISAILIYLPLCACLK